MNRDIIAFTKYKFNVYGKKDIRSGRDSAVVGIVGKSKSLDFPTMLIFWSLVRNSVVLAVYLLFSVACFLTVHEHFLSKYIEVKRNPDSHVQFISRYKDENSQVKCEIAEAFELLEHNAIMDTFRQLYREEIGVALR